jgi:hypothetical protein
MSKKRRPPVDEFDTFFEADPRKRKKAIRKMLDQPTFYPTELSLSATDLEAMARPWGAGQIT